MSVTDSWLCPHHGDFTSLTACLEVDCAHARLAKAAPEMLAVLALAADWIENGDENLRPALLTAMRATIAKASPVPHIERCETPIRGPLGSVVGHCDLHVDHDGVCSVRGTTEQSMRDRLIAEANVAATAADEDRNDYHED